MKVFRCSTDYRIRISDPRFFLIPERFLLEQEWELTDDEQFEPTNWVLLRDTNTCLTSLRRSAWMEWAHERKGRARETGERRGNSHSLACLPLARRFFLSPKYFQVAAKHSNTSLCLVGDVQECFQLCYTGRAILAGNVTTCQHFAYQD